MFVISLNYIKSLEIVNSYLEEHRTFLEKYFRANIFIIAGKKQPRTGGIIICNAPNKTLVEEIIKEDPFYKNEIAKFEITEFLPTKAQDIFQGYI